MSDEATLFHRRHRKRLGMCWRCLRRYPCGVIRAFERGYVVGWDAVERLVALRDKASTSRRSSTRN